MQLKPATRPPASQARPIRQTPQNQQHKLPATKPAKEKEKPKPSEAN
jgi:hypothetical protein